LRTGWRLLTRLSRCFDMWLPRPPASDAWDILLPSSRMPTDTGDTLHRRAATLFCLYPHRLSFCDVNLLHRRRRGVASFTTIPLNHCSLLTTPRGFYRPLPMPAVRSVPFFADTSAGCAAVTYHALPSSRRQHLPLPAPHYAPLLPSSPPCLTTTTTTTYARTCHAATWWNTAHTPLSRADSWRGA